MSADGAGYIGKRVPRVEDYRFLRGIGQYLNDLPQTGATVTVAFVRSPYAHARLLGVDVAAARQTAGVVGVWTGADLSPHIRPIVTPIALTGYCTVPQPCIATAKVCYVGEIVAVVAAVDRYVAEDAVGLVAAEYADLPVVVDPHRAEEAGAAQIHPEAPGNVIYRGTGSFGSIDEAFTTADHVVSGVFSTGRVTGVSMEGRGCLAQYNWRAGQLEVQSSTQVPSMLQRLVASCLGMPETQVRVITPDVGGGFGIKCNIYPEEVLVAHVARVLDRPVKWVQDRREDLMCGVHCREHEYRIEAAARQDGTILGVRVHMLTDGGAYPSYPFGGTLEATGGARMLLGPYRVRNYAYETTVVATNKAPSGPYRGVAQPSCCLAMEGTVELVARRLGLDPQEVRRRNILRGSEVPYTNPAGIHFDSGSFDECLEKALKLIDYEHIRSQANAANKTRLTPPGGRGSEGLVGVGVACLTEVTGINAAGYMGMRGVKAVPGYDSARVVMEPSGNVAVMTIIASQGQGHETTLAQVAASELDIPIEWVRVLEGDTGIAPSGSGVFASRTAITGSGAVHRAARIIRERLLRVAGEHLDLPTAALTIRDGFIYQGENAHPCLSVVDAARQAYHMDPPYGTREGIGLEAVAFYDPPPTNWSNATHAAVVEIEPETGMVHVRKYAVVHDCGRIINPTIVEGQVLGGLGQGIGEALSEALIYDDAGQLLTGTLVDYVLPQATTMPEIALDHVETPCPSTEGGYKGMGEGGVIGALPAIVNAVNFALAAIDPGIEPVCSVPIRPAEILSRLHQARALGL